MLLPKQKNNLIPDGWDSFSPYGNEGEETRAPLEVFEKGYQQNILLNGSFKQDLTGWEPVSPNRDDLVIVDGKLKISMRDGASYPVTNYAAHYPNQEFKANNKYYITYFIDDYGSQVDLEIRFTMSPGNTPYDYRKVEVGKTSFILTPNEPKSSGWIGLQKIDELNYKDYLILSNLKIINLTELFGAGKEPDLDWCDKNLKIGDNWNDIPEQDKPVRAWDNMAIHFTPLGNGLTRIQTWGGNSDTKLRFEKPFDNEDLTFSTYLENVGEEPLGIKSFDNKTEYYEPNFKGMVEQNGKG